MPPTISAITTGSTGPPNDTIAAPTTTVEAELRAQLLARLDGPRGAIEAAVPTALFTLAHLVTGELTPAVMLSIGSALVVLLIRSVQRCTARPAFHGLWGAGLAALVATWTGQAEAAFLPDIITAATWAILLGGSVLVGRPVAGYVIGTVLGDITGWRQEPGLVRLANRLTLVLAAPMVLRAMVTYPLFLASEVGWLGAARIALGWPLALATFATAAAILARGQTPLPTSASPRSGDHRPHGGAR